MHEDEPARLGARRSAVPPRLPLAAAAWAGPWPLKTSCDGLDASGSNGLQAGLLETVLPEGSPVIAGSVPTLIIYRVAEDVGVGDLACCCGPGQARRCSARACGAASPTSTASGRAPPSGT